jgi:hypothetical protein
MPGPLGGLMKDYQIIIQTIMMYGYSLMGGGLGFLTWLVVFIDLILVGVWLWKQIKKEPK